MWVDNTRQGEGGEEEEEEERGKRHTKGTIKVEAAALGGTVQVKPALAVPAPERELLGTHKGVTLLCKEGKGEEEGVW
jgi:hypothetical protein